MINNPLIRQQKDSLRLIILEKKR